MSEHIRNISGKLSDSYLVEHFNSPDHSINDLAIQVLQVLEAGTDTQTRLSQEDMWIRALNTSFPFGLNDKIKGYGVISSGLNPVEKQNHPYFSLAVPSRPRSSRCRTRKRNYGSLSKVCEITANFNDATCTARDVYKSLSSLSHKNLSLVHQKLISNTTVLSDKTRLAVLAMVAARLSTKGNRSKDSRQSIFVRVQFSNKGTDLIKLHNLFADTSLLKLLHPELPQKYRILTSYAYDCSIGLRFCTHTKLLKNLQANQLQLELSKSCHCQNEFADFLYAPAGHVITGDVRVVRNSQLRSIMSLGANYRLPKGVDADVVRDTAYEAVQALISKLPRSLKIAKANIDEFSARAYSIIDRRVQSLLFNRRHFEPSTNLAAVFKAHRRLSEDFVVTTVDKASNNFVFICKKYYLEVICQELGISFDSNNGITIQGNETYKHVPALPSHALIPLHRSLCNRFNVSMSQSDTCLPIIFAIPKLHKTPYKFRFIAGARHSSMKSLSVLLSKVLKHFRQHFRNYCKTTGSLRGLNLYWSVDNSKQVINLLEKVNNSIDFICSGDFSTLYTKLPHDSVKRQLFWLCDLLFRNTGKQYICVGYSKVYYSDMKTSDACFTAVEIKELIDAVLGNTFILFAGFTFQQTLGVPMGGNASPQLADLTLSCYEFQFLTDKNNFGIAKKLKYTCRYVDDNLSVNFPEFLNICEKIYPSALPISDTSLTPTYCEYLDLAITANGGVLKLDLYNKTNAFSFDVLRYVHSTSNVSNNLALNVFFSQLYRVATICNGKTQFLKHVTILVSEFRNKGYKIDTLKQKFWSFCCKYRALITKFGVSNKIQAFNFFAICVK